MLAAHLDNPQYGFAVIEQLYCEHQKVMIKIAFRILRDHQLAEDAVQQAFFRISANLGALKRIRLGNCRSYLITVVRNVALDMYSKRKKDNTISLEELLLPVASKHDMAAEFYLQEIYQHAIGYLPTTYSSVLKLRYLQGYSVHEISTILHVREDAIRKRIARGKYALARFLLQKYNISV